jgi:ubiquinone biosynthesis protein
MQAPEGPARNQAARQLLESYYKQIMTDGFFHADPHPGNLMWWKDRVYFLDFGMVGNLETELRGHLMLLLMSFWQEDAEFLTDVTLLLSGTVDRSDLDMNRYQAEIGELMAKYRSSGLAEMQVGPILQEMSEISLRHGVPLAASLALIGKALAQVQLATVQLATVQLDPTLGSFEVAGKILTRSLLQGMKTTLSPKTLLYQLQKLKVRALRAIETFERLIGARPGQKLVVNFRAGALEETVHRAGRRLALG